MILGWEAGHNIIYFFLNNNSICSSINLSSKLNLLTRKINNHLAVAGHKNIKMDHEVSPI